MSVTVWVTKACNLSCKYCYEGQDKSCENMSFKTVEAVIQWIHIYMEKRKCTFLILRFHGGEPTINIDVVKYFVNKLNHEEGISVRYEMTTNGYHLTQEALTFLCENMTRLSISLDGLKKIHDQYRVSANGLGTFDEVLKCAKIINKYEDKLVIRMTLNAKDVELLYQSVKELVNNSFRNIIIVVNAFDENWKLESVEELELQCKRIRSTFINDEYNISLPIGTTCMNHGICLGGIDTFNILPNGELYPCPYAIEQEFCLGDVFGGIDQNNVDKILKISKMPLITCEGCGGYESCTSIRCKFFNKKITGEFDSPIALLCELHRRNMNFT